MSVSENQRLLDDALLEIFSYLDADDLWSCEKVCVGWQNVISCEILWKKIFLRKTKFNPRWRKMCERLSKMDREYKDYSYKLKFHILYDEIEYLDGNWRSGNFTDKSVFMESQSLFPAIDMDDDYVNVSSFSQLFIYERTNMTRSYSLDVPGNWNHRNNIIGHNLIFFGEKDRIRVFDARNGNEICEIFDPRERDLGRMCVNSRKQLAVLGHFPETNHLTVWKMEGPTDYRQIHQEYFKGARAAVFSDEDYIVLAFDYSWREYEVRLISTTTCNTERSFCMSRAFFHYDRGLLFVSIKTDDTIRIMEAKTGKWIKIIYLETSLHIGFFFPETYFPARLNSTCMVTVTNSAEWQPILSVYDLEAIRNPSSTECLLTTIPLPDLDEMDGFTMDETQIVFTGPEYRERENQQRLTVLDFY